MSYEIFEKLCKERGVKPIDVSRAKAISTATFTNWKQGKYVPRHETLEKIADYFDVKVEFLKTGKVEEGYYVSSEAAEVAQELFERPGMRVLFEAAKDASPEDLKLATDILLRLKEQKGDS